MSSPMSAAAKKKETDFSCLFLLQSILKWGSSKSLNFIESLYFI